MASQQHSESFEDNCSLSNFDSAGLSLCNVSEMENFTGNSNLEIQTGSIEFVNVTNEGVQSASPLWNLFSRNRVTHVRGDIDDPCGVIADFCGVIADPCGVVVIPEAIGHCR